MIECVVFHFLNRNINNIISQTYIQFIYKNQIIQKVHTYTPLYQLSQRLNRQIDLKIQIMQSRHLIPNDNNNQKLYQQMKFLQTQNQRLKQQLSDAKDLIQMNKLQIDVLSKDKSHDKKLVDVIFNYRQQVQTLQKKIVAINQQCQKLISEKLVIQQVNQELSSEQKSIEELYKSRNKQLLEMMKILEDKIQTCEKSHQNYDNITGFVQKNRQLFTPLDQAIEFKNKQNSWSQEISYLKEQLCDHKKNQQNLLLANGILRNKVVSLQAKLAMPNKNLGQILDKSLKRLMLYFIQTQKKMLTGDDSDSQQQDLQLIAPQLISLFPQKQKNSNSEFKVPSLDILKVRNHQMKGNQKIKQQLLRRNHLSKDEKIQRLQVQLQFTRRSLTKNMIQLKTQIQRRKLLERICQELEDRNQFILKSNDMYKKRLDKIRKQYQTNKEKLISMQKIQFLDQDIVQPSFLKKQARQQNSIQSQQRVRQNQVNKYLQNVQTPFQYKLHLQLLAKDLNRNTKLKNIKQRKLKKTQTMDQNQKMQKLKRSTSNPFLYFNQRRQKIMQVQPQRQKNNQNNNDVGQRLQQTQYLPMGQNRIFKFNEDLDDLDDEV